MITPTSRTGRRVRSPPDAMMTGSGGTASPRMVACSGELRGTLGPVNAYAALLTASSRANVCRLPTLRNASKTGKYLAWGRALPLSQL
jgi:hypothetical protein